LAAYLNFFLCIDVGRRRQAGARGELHHCGRACVCVSQRQTCGPWQRAGQSRNAHRSVILW
jgi:hypothetical protein